MSPAGRQIWARAQSEIELLPKFVDLQETFTSLAFALLKKAADLAASGEGRGKIDWGIDI